MPVGQQANVLGSDSEEALDRAVDLLSQQIWCWGQDVLRPEGNWLIATGFERLPAPADREQCSSVYTLELPQGRRVVLRGFGVFFGDDRLGGVFLKRYAFEPQYTPQAMLECPPWSSEDLPVLRRPTQAQHEDAASLTVYLLDWIHAYEVDIAKRLGIAYRRSTLDNWKRNKRPLIPAEEMASCWRSLSSRWSRNSLPCR